MITDYKPEFTYIIRDNFYNEVPNHKDDFNEYFSWLKNKYHIVDPSFDKDEYNIWFENDTYEMIFRLEYAEWILQ